MNHEPPILEPLAPPEPARAAGKFLHASGARPVEGFTIKRGIGRGGFGEVYFATSDAGKEVALKLIRRNLEVELRGVRHCLNLKHHNLIALYDIRSDAQDDQWVVMEYVPGESLEQAIERQPHGMPVEQAIEWLRGIAAGVTYLHDNGIVHRDLKPGNIFLDPAAGAGGGLLGGTVKIGDYGLSKFISCSRRSGQTESVGTVHYMAPEIANGRYGREIDIYAIGVMLYEMLTGQVPFAGESVGEVLMKHLTAEPELSKLAEPYRTMEARCLAKDPARRVASVQELVEMLPQENAASHSPGTPKTGPQAAVRVANYAPQRAPATGAEEPIWAAIRTAYFGAKNGWDIWETTPLVKSVALLGGLAVAFMSLGVIVSLGVMFAMFYCVYYPVWAVFLKPHAPVAPVVLVAGAQPQAVAPMTRSERREEQRRKRYGWKDIVHQELRAKSLRTRVTELLGSMLIAAAVCVALGGLADALLSQGHNSPSLWLWITMVSTLGSWSILLVGKLTEARFEDQLPMRLLQLVLGGCLGFFAWGLSDHLRQEVPNGNWGPRTHETIACQIGLVNSSAFTHQPEGMNIPSQLASIVYFAGLLSLLRWWKLADVTRAHRMNLWSSLWLAFAAWLLHIVWWYPQPSGLALALVMAVAVQVASPWVLPSRRVELAKQAVYTV